jgi:hypothetical protein
VLCRSNTRMKMVCSVTINKSPFHTSGLVGKLHRHANPLANTFLQALVYQLIVA